MVCLAGQVDRQCASAEALQRPSLAIRPDGVTVNNVHLTDLQWAVITKRLKLTVEARVDIELAIHAYRGQRALWHRPPAAVGKRLKQTSAAARKLANLLERLEEQDRIEIVEAWPIGRRAIQGARIETIVAEIKELSTVCANASEQVSNVSRIYSLDQLIANLDKILRRFGERGASRAKAAMSFLVAVCCIADQGLGTGAIEEAIKRLQGRGEITTKKIRKSTPESAR
jgi:hypothetical protein